MTRAVALGSCFMRSATSSRMALAMLVRRAEPDSKWISSVRMSTGWRSGTIGGGVGGTGAGAGASGGGATGGGGGGGASTRVKRSGAKVRPTRPERPQSSSSVKRHSSLLSRNLATFQRAPALSDQPLVPNQWRRPLTRNTGLSGAWSPPVYQTVLSSFTQLVVPNMLIGMFRPASKRTSFGTETSPAPPMTLSFSRSPRMTYLSD